MRESAPARTAASAVMPPSEPAWKFAALASADMPVACVGSP